SLEPVEEATRRVPSWVPRRNTPGGQVAPWSKGQAPGTRWSVQLDRGRPAGATELRGPGSGDPVPRPLPGVGCARLPVAAALGRGPAHGAAARAVDRRRGH